MFEEGLSKADINDSGYSRAYVCVMKSASVKVVLAYKTVNTIKRSH